MKTGSMRMTKRSKKPYIEWLNDPFSVSKREKFKAHLAKVQTDLRAMQDQWWRDKAADTHNAKKFFSLLKTVFGPSASCSAPLLSSDGKMLIKDQEHFSTLLNRPSSVDSDTLNQIPANSPYEFRSQNPLPSRRSRRRSTRQSPAEHRERMASLLRSTR